MAQFDGQNPETNLPFDPLEGLPIPCLHIDERTSIAVLRTPQLLHLVPNPVASEDPKRTSGDPVLSSYADLRLEMQRLVEGAKAKNAVRYGRYIVDGLKGVHPWITPPMTLFHQSRLKQIRFPGGLPALLLPYGDFLVAIDGETQRIAWQFATNVYAPALDRNVAVVIHHGKSIEEARQGFYDLNLREVKPTASLAIGMDTQDVATQITRHLISEIPVIRDKVHFKRRQLRKKDPQVLTISALRTGVVTTILGAQGLQTGSRPIELPQDSTVKTLQAAVTETWSGILQSLKDELDPRRRSNSLVSAPGVFAGIGIVAHHAMPHPPRDTSIEPWTVTGVLEKLNGINWSRLDESGSPWEGVAGKLTPKGRFSVGGPKEIGYAVARALEEEASEPGQRIRRFRASSPIQMQVN